MIKAVFFDINETILDLKVINKKFDKYFESQHVGEYWFSKLLHTSNIMSIMNEYVDFNKLAEIVLENIFYENDNYKLNNRIEKNNKYLSNFLEDIKDIQNIIINTENNLFLYRKLKEIRYK